MKKVYLVRHAKSSWENPSLRDIERPLNSRGLRDAPFMASLLKGHGVIPDRIISSPANRAFTTATYFAKESGIGDDEIDVRHDVYEAFPQTILSIIRSLDKSVSTVLLFGHNPTFTSLANMFTDDYIPNVPTCGIVEITTQTTDWSLFNENTARLTAY